MKVFADTNFLISAFTGRGLSADVFQLVLAEHQLMTGEYILSEFHRVLISKFRMPEKLVKEAEDILRGYHVKAIPETLTVPKIDDPDDQWVLQSALNAGADVLITGDKDLLTVADKISDIRICNPRAFWELVQE